MTKPDPFGMTKPDPFGMTKLDPFGMTKLDPFGMTRNVPFILHPSHFLLSYQSHAGALNFAHQRIAGDKTLWRKGGRPVTDAVSSAIAKSP